MTATLSPAEDVQTTAPRHGVQRVENTSQLIWCCARAAFSPSLVHYENVILGFCGTDT